MSFILDPLIYAYFAKGGLTALANQRIPLEVQQAFLEDIVSEYWDAADPPPPGFRAAFLRQIAPDQSLFGWLYSEIDHQTQGLFPVAIGYFLNTTLNGDLLQLIFGCLERGPLSCPDLEDAPEPLDEVTLPETLAYEPARPGVPLPSGIYARSRLLLVKQRMLDIYVPYEPETAPALGDLPPSSEELMALTGETPEMSPWPIPEEAFNDETLPAAAPMVGLGGTNQKMALLIGVNGYGEGFQPLLGVEQDVQTMAQVLAHPSLGGFTQVKTLLNPDCQVMSEAIESLFLDCQPEDLVLLYLSGYGIRDRQGNISLATGISRRGRQQKVIRSTVIPASFLRTIMDESPSRQQVLVLDCCFVEAFPRETLSLARPPKVEAELGGPQRLILSTCITSAYTTTQKEREPSLYTRYLVEGLATGAADLNHDGVVTLQEWHTYARQRAMQSAPVMTPQCYGVAELQALGLATAPTTDPRLKYRKHVEQGLQDGEISALHRTVLDALQARWGIAAPDAKLIEAEVLQPYLAYRRKIQTYARQLLKTHWQSTGLQPREQVDPGETVNESEGLLALQEALGLTSADTQAITAEIQFQFKCLQALEPDIGTPETMPAGTGWPWLQALRAKTGQSLPQVSAGLSKIPGWTTLQTQWQRYPRRFWIGGGGIALLILLGVLISTQARQRSPRPTTSLELGPSCLASRWLGEFDPLSCKVNS